LAKPVHQGRDTQPVYVSLPREPQGRTGRGGDCYANASLLQPSKALPG
jgi:hypothetical protein